MSVSEPGGRFLPTSRIALPALGEMLTLFSIQFRKSEMHTQGSTEHCMEARTVPKSKGRQGITWHINRGVPLWPN